MPASTSPRPFTMAQLFDSGKYMIPIYQRNYAWGEQEIFQLIQDVWDYAREKPEANYYIGTLIVYSREHGGEVVYETIDGQQRLTTLNILVNALRRKETSSSHGLKGGLNLYFDSRKKSSETLKVIGDDTMELEYNVTKDDFYNPKIQQAYRDIEKTLDSLMNPAQLDQFVKYFSTKVLLLRVEVPADTDLNHYFEIMNTRGEQLEKHEILKANLLKVLQDDDQLSHAFAIIWEACSDMEGYMQYAIDVDIRDALFQKWNWNHLKTSDLTEIAEVVAIHQNKKEMDHFQSAKGLEDIIDDAPISFKETDEDDEPDRFNSVINFPNFLLHVLRIQTGEDISLDDKQLLIIFGDQLKKVSSPIAFVKEFGGNLLRYKWLFDQFIIKREITHKREDWSLKRLKHQKKRGDRRGNYVNTFGDESIVEDLNKDLIMLQSMFHVSTPTMIYKHWLNAALKFVVDHVNDGYVNPNDFRDYLIRLAKAYVYDRYLAKEEDQVDFYDIIYARGGFSKNESELEKHQWNLLHRGTKVENFIFNYLDFILWKSDRTFKYKKDFSFAFRSSVEHYYPQNPLAKEEEQLPEDVLDHFGNLCLISSSKNSRLSNYLPQAKKDHYINNQVDSLKQAVMMEGDDRWFTDQIRKHGEEMIEEIKLFWP